MNSKMAWELFKKWTVFTSLLGICWFGMLKYTANPSITAGDPWFVDTTTSLNFLTGLIFSAIIFFFLSQSEKCFKIWSYQDEAIIASLVLGCIYPVIMSGSGIIWFVMVTFCFAVLTLFALEISWGKKGKKNLLKEIKSEERFFEYQNTRLVQYVQPEINAIREKIKALQEKLECAEDDDIAKYVLASTFFSIPYALLLGLPAGILVLLELLLIWIIENSLFSCLSFGRKLADKLFCEAVPNGASAIWNSGPITSLRVWLTTIKEE